MYNANLFQNNWWNQQRNKKKEYMPPEKCTFCNKKIEDGDHFHAGYDEHRIYAETCDDLKCHTWLKHKVRKKKVDKDTYR